jgi:glucose repression regulatory protein TUP1
MTTPATRISLETLCFTRHPLPQSARILRSGSVDKSVRVWELATGKLLFVAQTGTGVETVTVSADGRTLTVRHTDKSDKVFDLATGKPIS